MQVVEQISILVAIGLVLGWFNTTGFKSQNIRILDVFVIGPLMIVGGMCGLKNEAWWGLPLIFFGATTITYNGKNYLVQRKLNVQD
jgi:hypothetical protein